MTTIARRPHRVAALGFLELHWRGLKPDTAAAVERRLQSPPGLGAVRSSTMRRASTSS